MKRLGALVLIALLAACGGGGGDKGYASTAAMAGELESVGLCDAFDQVPGEDAEFFVADQADCRTRSGHDLTLYVFASDDTQASFDSLAEEFGGGYVKGDRWAVAGGTPDEQASARTALR